jgi:hypothetical protein
MAYSWLASTHTWLNNGGYIKIATNSTALDEIVQHFQLVAEAEPSVVCSICQRLSFRVARDGSCSESDKWVTSYWEKRHTYAGSIPHRATGIFLSLALHQALFSVSHERKTRSCPTHMQLLLLTHTNETKGCYRLAPTHTNEITPSFHGKSRYMCRDNISQGHA